MERADKLYQQLKDIQLQSKPTLKWSPWPFLRIQLPEEVLKNIKDTARIDRAREALLEKATIVEYSDGLPSIFGKNQCEKSTPLNSLVDCGKVKNEESSAWLNVITQQVVDGVEDREPNVRRWERRRRVRGEDEYAPGVGHIKSDAGMLEFDIYFFRIGCFPTVSSRMTRLATMYHLDLAKYQAKDFVLREELEDLERRGWNRLSVLDNERPKYIVHLSMVDRFLRRRAYQGVSVNELTLAQLLGDDKLEKTFAETWITVPKTVSIGEAEKLRRSKRGCQDLFVTENGDPAEPVLRWLTDGEIASAMDEIT